MSLTLMHLLNSSLATNQPLKQDEGQIFEVRMKA